MIHILKIWDETLQILQYLNLDMNFFENIDIEFRPSVQLRRRNLFIRKVVQLKPDIKIVRE